MNLPRAYEQEMKELLGTELEAYKKSLDLPRHDPSQYVYHARLFDHRCEY